MESPKIFNAEGSRKRMRKKPDDTNTKVIASHLTTSIITLNANGLNILNRSERFSDKEEKKRPNYMLPTRKPL